MKKWNHLMLIAAAASIGVSLSAETCKPSANSQLTDNVALLSSPRYREDHPELLRSVASGNDTSARKAQRLAALTKNVALANSPRFREEHPELLWAAISEEHAQAASDADRSRKLTENAALEDSPRFRETHPELSLVQSVPEIARPN
jgi:hypothetical protein